MRHRILTCKNHPDLRWSTKDIAWTEGVGYNGMRLLFFTGSPTGRGMYHDGSGLHTSQVREDGSIVEECGCELRDLVLAPEDSEVTR